MFRWLKSLFEPAPVHPLKARVGDLVMSKKHRVYEVAEIKRQSNGDVLYICDSLPYRDSTGEIVVDQLITNNPKLAGGG